MPTCWLEWFSFTEMPTLQSGKTYWKKERPNKGLETVSGDILVTERGLHILIGFYLSLPTCAYRTVSDSRQTAAQRWWRLYIKCLIFQIHVVLSGTREKQNKAGIITNFKWYGLQKISHVQTAEGGYIPKYVYLAVWPSAYQGIPVLSNNKTALLLLASTSVILVSFSDHHEILGLSLLSSLNSIIIRGYTASKVSIICIVHV